MIKLALVIVALLGRQQINELIHFGFQKCPPALQVPQQTMRFVLGYDTDSADAGV